LRMSSVRSLEGVSWRGWRGVSLVEDLVLRNEGLVNEWIE